MFKPDRTRDEKSLSERLRREALDARPEFSEALHERICRAVRECGPGEAPVARRVADGALALRFAMVAAAACVLAALVLVWQSNRSALGPDVVKVDRPAERPSDHDAPPVPAGPDLTADLSPVSVLTGRVAARIPALVDSTFAIQQWAYLDHDARLSAELLTRRLPLEVGSLLASSEATRSP